MMEDFRKKFKGTVSADWIRPEMVWLNKPWCVRGCGFLNSPFICNGWLKFLQTTETFTNIFLGGGEGGERLALARFRYPLAAF
jgi:hypothetical protein